MPDPFLVAVDRPFEADRHGPSRTDLIQRLLADECEICGSTDRVQVHHVRKLADLKQRWQGRREKPRWVQYMLARRRKTLVVCHGCHTAIHAGRPTRTRPTQDPADWTSTTGEPDAVKVARPVVCPEKADVLSGSQTRRGKSRNPVAWMAGRRETDCPEAHRHGHPRDGRRVPGP